ncbi:MAG: glutamate-5-semialdehyde dehydrogenase [Lachnospiraceae bacterium]|nr:glutamate-5-semialdehyde dehydrogenase [Lachnospiraceae bacterium]
MQQLIKNAKRAAESLYVMSDKQIADILSAVCQKLSENKQFILEQNRKDLKLAEAHGLTSLRLQRLTLTSDLLNETIERMQRLAEQSDVVNVCEQSWELPNHMTAARKKVPIGTIAAVYETRPTATFEIMALCLRTGNSCILRSGSEMLETNRAIVSLTQNALIECGLSIKAVQLLEDCSEDSLCRLMENDSLDLLLARGNQQLITLVQETANVPWICLGPGNCHVYVDRKADEDMALEIIATAKSKPLLCNSVETTLIHYEIADSFLPKLAARLSREGISLHGCLDSCRISSAIQPVLEHEYASEANDLILDVKIVSDMEQAVDHIKHYGSGHSEAIVTNDSETAAQFSNMVDAGVVYTNASPRFTDGESLGFGMEVGISTQKLHIRGPVTLSGLTTWKYVVQGCGNTR